MSLPSIDLRGPAFHVDPYKVYAVLREQDTPYYLAEENAWVFTRYDDVTAMLKDPRVSKQIRRPVPSPIDMTMLFQDPPAHHRLRGLVNQAFTRSHVQALESRIAAIADRLIDSVLPRQKMDFIADFALPLPLMVITDMLGVPEAERETFHHWANLYVTSAVESPTPESLQHHESAMKALIAFFTDLVERRRKEPQADLLSALIEAHDAEDRLSLMELIGTVILLLIAGYETTVNLLGNGLYCLLRYPDQFALLKQQPDRIESALNEMLRCESPVQRGTFRMTSETISFKGIEIKPGTQIWAYIGAANRDPDYFPDPNRFDIARDPNRHIAFGFGVHYCLGASLARAEARIGFECLFRRLPGLQAAVEFPAWIPGPLTPVLRSVGLERTLGQPSPPQWRHNAMVRSLKHLSVTW